MKCFAACKTEQHNGERPSLLDPGGHHRNVSLSAFTPAAHYKHTLIKAPRKTQPLSLHYGNDDMTPKGEGHQGSGNNAASV